MENAVEDGTGEAGDMTASGLRLRLACSLGERLFGLLRNKVCAHGEVLALLPCRSVHSFGMRAAIDVAFIDRQGRVLKAARALPPGRILSCAQAVGTLERRAEQGKPWFRPGETVRLVAGTAEHIQRTEGKAR
jgi:uncharacterized membrane protein (UPF0127 family)